MMLLARRRRHYRGRLAALQAGSRAGHFIDGQAHIIRLLGRRDA